MSHGNNKYRVNSLKGLNLVFWECCYSYLILKIGNQVLEQVLSRSLSQLFTATAQLNLMELKKEIRGQRNKQINIISLLVVCFKHLMKNTPLPKKTPQIPLIIT